LPAYVFWHQPGDGVDSAEYEQGLRAFHQALDLSSGSFRLEQLPFATSSGYEDWYLVETWTALGELNELAIDARHRIAHDRVAVRTGRGWGGVYELLRGEAQVPTGTEWFDKPRGEPSEAFLATRSEEAIWRRQMVLGPAPEFCAATEATAGRIAI
jgi:hypothetical protein